jgi:hypothetical protein
LRLSAPSFGSRTPSRAGETTREEAIEQLVDAGADRREATEVVGLWRRGGIADVIPHDA